jgi:hypothetical protein
MNLRHDVLAIDDDRRASWRSQRHMQRRSIFSDVDFLSSKHRIDSGAQPALFCQFEKQP